MADVGRADRQSWPNPLERPHQRNRRLDAALSLHHACDHAPPADDRLERAIRFRRMAGLFAFFYGTLHLLTYVIADRFAGLGFPEWLRRLAHSHRSRERRVGRHLQKTIHNSRIHSVGDDGAPRHHFNRRHDSSARRQALDPLHTVVYATAVLGAMHYWWFVKADVRRPLAYAAVIALLLTFRVVLETSARVPAGVRRAPSGETG